MHDEEETRMLVPEAGAPGPVWGTGGRVTWQGVGLVSCLDTPFQVPRPNPFKLSITLWFVSSLEAANASVQGRSRVCGIPLR